MSPIEFLGSFQIDLSDVIQLYARMDAKRLGQQSYISYILKFIFDNKN